MIGYVILENSDLGPITEESKLDFVGFAKSVREADKMIRSDVRDHLHPDSINENFADYCSHYLICDIFGEVKPLPSVAVRIKLETV